MRFSRSSSYRVGDESRDPEKDVIIVGGFLIGCSDLTALVDMFESPASYKIEY